MSSVVDSAVDSARVLCYANRKSAVAEHLLAGAFILFAARAFAAHPLAEQQIDLPRPAELRAVVSARCPDCSWQIEGREAVTLTISVDGKYAEHLPLVRGTADYAVMLGSAAAGSHHVSLSIDRDGTAASLRSDDAATAQITVSPMFDDAPEYLPTALAPIVYARPNTVGRFTDTPVFMWYEVEPTPRGTRYRYSVIFTNEDGGTPADRLMATWGRTTDIEYIYSVEVDAAGKILGEDYQGPDHQVLEFHGTREARHPLLWVATDNNMVRDIGDTRIRYAPAPERFDLRDVSREAVMDAHPWLYAVMTQELRREGKVDEHGAPGRGTIPDPRRYVYIEACGEVGHAAVAFAVNVRATWISSDRGIPRYRIVRDGCFRGAVPLPEGARARDIRALRVLAYDRPPAKDSPATPAGPVHLTHVNKVFMLDERFVPQPSILEWRGSETIRPGGPPFETGVR